MDINVKMKVLTFNTALLDVSDIKTQINKILKHLVAGDDVCAY